MALGFRRLTGPLGVAVKVVLICIPVTAIIYIVDVPGYLGMSVYAPQYLGLFLVFTLSAIFLTIPATKSAARDILPYYDAFLIALSILVGGYVTLFYPHLLVTLGFITTTKLVLGSIAILLVIEATRRVLGWPLVIMGIIFVLYPFISHLLPGIFNTRQLLWSRIIIFFYLDPNGLFGIPLNIAGTMVLSFIFFGGCLFAAGGGKFLTDLSMALLGKYRGGPAKIGILASCLFGSISGSASANVAATGTITIPLMKRIGYKPHFAAAVEAVASTGGCITPPVMAAAAFLIAEFLGISYFHVAIAAAVPAILYFIAVFTQVDLEAAKNQLKGLPASELPSLREVLKKGALYIVPLIVLIYFLFVLNQDPSISALTAVAATFLVSFARKESRASILQLPRIFENTGRALLEIGAVCMVAGFIVGAVSMTGLGVTLSQMLIAISGGNTFILLLTSAICCIILGMGMPVTPIYIIVVTLIGPALIKMGIEPLSAHLFIFYFGILSFITPPVCTATYVAAGIAGSEPLRTAWTGIRLGIAAYLVPFIFAFAPALILIGSWTDMAIVIPTAIAGIVMIAIALGGYAMNRLNLLERIWAAIGGLGLLIHIQTWTVAGFAITVTFIIYTLLQRKIRTSAERQKIK